MKKEQYIRNQSWLAVALLMIILPILAACAPTSPSATTAPDLQATIDVMQTQLAQDKQPTAEASLPPAKSTAGPSEKPTPTPGEIQSDYAGFMVFADQKFTGYDFNGKPTGFNVDAPGVEGLNLFAASVFSGGLVYANVQAGKIMQVTADGAHPLDLISTDKSATAVISPDGSKIAWSYEFYSGDAPGAELWVANIDGSGQQKIAEILPADNTDHWLVLRPLEWTSDGKLLYGTQLTGIGGYILYLGWNSLRLYNPADGSLKTLVEDEAFGMCVNSLSPDRSHAALGCDKIHIRKLSDGSEVVLPALVEQNVVGSAQFSPSGAWIAYATALSDPNNERSQVVVAASDGSGEPQPLQTMEGGDFHVLGWINEDTFLFTVHKTMDNTTTIWRIDRDGSRPTQLLEAQFLGFIPAK